MAQLKLVQKPAQGEYLTVTNWADALSYFGFWIGPGQGYLLPSDHPNVTRLDLYVRRDQADHLTTATAQGRADAVNSGYDYRGTLGWVSSVDGPGLLPLKLYYHRGKQDNATVAAADNERVLQQQGYQFVRIEGFVSSRPLTVEAQLSSQPGGGFSIDTTASLDPSGRMSATTYVTNHNWFWGFRAGFFVLYSDGNGATLGMSTPPDRRYGAWATAMGAPVQRRIEWTDQIAPATAEKVVRLVIVQFGADSPDSVLDQIAGYAQQAVAIAEPVLAVADKLIKLKAAVSAAG